MKQVAVRAGKSSQWLSDRLHGRAPIYADDVLLLAKGLNIDPCDFFRENVEPAPIPSREDREALNPQEQVMYDDLLALLADRLEEPAASTAATIIDFLRYQRERQQRDQQQQWQQQLRRDREAVNDDTPERG